MRNFQSGKTWSALSEALPKDRESYAFCYYFPRELFTFFFFNSPTAPPSLTYWDRVICNLPDRMKNEATLTRGTHSLMITIFTLDSFIDPSVHFVKGTLITWNLHHKSQHEHAGQDKALRMLYFFHVATYFHSWELLYNRWWGKKLSYRNVQSQ